jgi:hypothetical protein
VAQAVGREEQVRVVDVIEIPRERVAFDEMKR